MGTGWWYGGGGSPAGTIFVAGGERELLRLGVTVGLGLAVAVGYGVIAFNWYFQAKLRRASDARAALTRLVWIVLASLACGVTYLLFADIGRELWPVYDAALLALACHTWWFVMRTRGLSLVDARLAEAEELEKSARRYREIAEHMPHVVWTAAVNGHVDFANDQWRAFAGLGRTWLDAVHPDDRPAVDVWWTTALVERKPVKREVRLRGAKGDVRTFLVSATPVVEGVAVKWFGACADIEDQKQLATEKERQARQKAFFFNALSHDLRAPLNNVVLNAQLLQMSANLNAEQNECADVVVENAMAASEMVTKLLDFARVGAMENNDLAPVSVGSVLHHVDRRFSPIASEKRLTLCVAGDRDVEITTDRHKVERIVSNLVDNAIKFTSEGTVTVELVARRSGDGHTVIRVTDTGHGVTAADAPHLFGEFFQADGPAPERVKGFGMGLAICRALARQLGGDVVLARTGPDGSTFELSLADLPNRDDQTVPMAKANGETAAPTGI